MRPTRIPSIAAVAVAGLIMLAGIAGCGSSNEAAADGGDGISIGGSGRMAWSQVWLADGLDLFGKADLRVERVDFASGRDATTALLAGKVDVATVAETPMVSAAIEDQDVKIIAQLATYSNYEMISADPAVDDFSDLRGKRVGTPVGTSSQYALHVGLRAAGLSEDDVETVNIKPGDLIAALGSGDVDAIVGFPPSTALEARDVFGSRYREDVVEQYEARHLIAASSRALADKPEEIERFLEQLIAADRELATRPRAELTRLIAANSNESPETLEAALGDYDFRVELGEPIVDQLIEEGEWAADQGLASESGDRALFQGIVDAGPLSAVAPDRVAPELRP
jgi:sulfonate transport system substrate-binding protein